MDLATKITRWADQIRGLAANGLRYAQNIYDRDRYAQLQKLAVEMYAQSTGKTEQEITPIIAPFLDHPTPAASADAAIVDDRGLMLLIRRADNGRWALPGGFLEVGETPAQGAVREAREESGIHCRAVGLVGVYDSRICGSITTRQLYMFTFLCVPTGITEKASYGHEVTEIAWFEQSELPTELSPGHHIRIPHAFEAWSGRKTSYVDL